MVSPAAKRPDRHRVHESARDLAKNLSRHTDERTQPFAKHLREQVEAITQLLSDPEITAAYGARSMWQGGAAILTAMRGPSLEILGAPR